MTVETIIEKLKWLETNIQPFDQVEQYWIDTFDERRNSLIQQKDKNESVYSKFECLKNENAVTLIHLDFKKILPSASDEHIEEYWPYLCRFIREYSKIDEQLYSNAVAQNLISLLAEEPDDNNGVLILLLLAHMLKSTSIKPAAPKKSGKKRKNLSGDTPPQKKNDKSEQLKEPDFVNDFLAIVKIDSQINERVEEKKRVAAQQKKTVQPYMLFVGGPEKCTSFYVIVDDYKYKVDNPLNALKLNFELFFFGNYEFPESCYNIWIFIQKFLFKTSTVGNKYPVKIKKMTGFIKYNMKIKL
ncbi:uncharacterized protein LOC141537021 [Cotesia typhae]|uniref:uncharacterized protein LOC141537021 n=1 Tax=Cotesia typhae TaxID=2053667 RepID=UPI003D6931E8